MGQLMRSDELLRDAAKRGYCVPAYNTINFETTHIVLRAAEAAGTPVILMYYPNPNMPPELYAHMARILGERSKVPFSIHLDHSPSYDLCLQCIKAGFTSVMIDLSKKPFEENAAGTREVVKAAHAMGVDVEGELGMVGRNEAVDRTRFTQPEEATRYVELAGVDTLAVAIGNSHGEYIEEPSLDIELLKNLKAAVDVPLVLHGSSLIPVDQINDAARHGICKMNIATEYWIRYKEVIQNTLNSEKPPKSLIDLLNRSQGDVIAFIADKMRALNPDGVSIV